MVHGVDTTLSKLQALDPQPDRRALKTFSSKQRRAAFALANPRIGPDLKDVAKHARISRAALTRYMRDTEFCSFVRSILPEFTDNMVMEAWKVLYKKAILEEDKDCLKLFFLLKKELSTITSVNISQTILTYEQHLMENPVLGTEHIPARRLVDAEAEELPGEEDEGAFEEEATLVG
jgi:hypothetical protein